MAVLSIGQVWADATFTSSSEAATSAKNGISLSVTSGSLASGDYYRIDKGATLTISSTSGNIESIVFTCTSGTYAKLASHSPEGTYSESGATVSWSGSASEVTFTAKTGSSNKNFRFSQVVITTAAGEDPTITLKQSNTAISKLDVAATSVANQAIDLEYANFAGSISSVTPKLYEESTCETEITSGAWVTDITINAAKTQLTFNVADNDGAARQVWLKVSATDGTGNASAVLNIKQAKYEAPFTGEVLEITKDDFASGSYAVNDGGITVEGFDFAVKDMYKNSNIIQAKASSGYIYNESILGEIVKIEITKSGASNNNFTVYEGTSEHPLTTSVSGDVDGTTTTYEFSEDQTYFTLKNGSTYSTVNPIKIYYYPITSAVTIDNSIENGSVGVTGAADLTQVAAGTVLTLSNTPDASYKLEEYDVYKTGDATTKVTITDGKFTMPAYAVTVSGSFELARDLTSIAISAEASKKTYLVDETFSSEGLEITASFSNAADAVVTPTSISSPDMSTAGVKTITISYTEGANTETTSYDITVKDAYTVTEILPMVPALNAGSLATRVKGYISQIDQYNSTYNSITYWISVDGKTTSDQLEVYSGKNVGNTDFSSIDDLAVGDFVTISGSVKTHTNGVKEFDKNNYIITGGRIQKGAVTTVTVSGTPTKTEYATNETFDPAGLVVTATYANGFSTVVTEGITWGNDLTDGKVTENTTVHVTATVSGITNDPAYDVPVTVAAKTLVSIAVGTASYTIYTGEALPQPVVTATFSEGEPEDVSAFAVYDSESVFNTATIDDPDPQTITVSYTFGGETKTTTYTVSVQDYENANDAPYSVTEALHIITAAIGNVESAREIVVTGTVSVENISGNKNRYKISDGVNELLVYAGKGFNNETFTNTNYPKVGDVVIVKGNVINFQGNTPEFASGKSYLLSQVRPATIAIENVASFEVGTADLAVTDLTVTTPSDGDITFVSGDDAVATIEANAIHAVAPGVVTITANLAATENDNALNYAAASTTFDVTVIAATVKYAISFDGNGADGGDAPEAIADKAAGEEVTLPANSYTKTGYTFTGWKVYDENEDEVTVTANAFTMPASPVTIKAQWAEIPVWAYTYTSNVTLSTEGGTSASAAKVKFYGEEGDGYDAIKAGTGSAQGAVVVNVPAGATALHFHAYGWNTENVGLTVTAPAGVTVSPATEISINSNSGIASNSPFTLAEGSTPMTDAYYVVSLSGNDDEIELTFSATSGKRFVLFGVNQEGGLVLESIAISGTATELEYNEGDHFDPTGLVVTGHYSDDSEATISEGIDWTFDPDPLTEGTTSVSVTATAGGFTSDAFVVNGLTVNGAAPLSPWATVYTSNVELSGSQNVKVTITVDEEDKNFDGVKMNKAAAATFTIPAGTTNLYAHMAAWNGEAQTVTVSGDCFDADKSIDIVADANISGSGTTYDIDDAKAPTDYFKEIVLDKEVTEPTEITITAASGKRFVLFGVNQVGGVLPVLKSIEISGDLTNKSGYKVGDDLDLDGLTVSAIYTLNEVDQAPIDVTSLVNWSYDPLVENQTSVTITATLEDKSDDITISDLEPVASADPVIYVDPSLTVNFGSVEVGEAVPANKTINVTLTNVAAATATLDGEGFSITPATLTASGDITVSVVASTASAANYSATLTISDDAAAATAKVISLSFAVTAPVVNEEYELVSDVNTLAAGDQIIIVAENAGTYYTLDGLITSQYFPSTAVSISAGIITAPTTSAIILGKDEDNWTMSMGGQLIGATAAKKASLGNGSASNTWTIAIAENVATITNTAEGYGSLQFNYNSGNNSRFLNYTSAQTAVAIYKKVAAPEPEYETVRSGLEINRYYTVCLPKKVTAIKGASFWTLKSKSQDGATAYLEEETNNLPFAAGKPFIIQATAEKLEVVYEGAATEDAGTNGALHGTLVYMDAAALADAGPGVYMLFSNELRPVGENNHLDANRAYVLLSELNAVAEAPQNAPGRRVVAMPMEKDVTTDINALNAAEAPVKMIIDGNLFILRGEKLYDATGRLVK